MTTRSAANRSDKRCEAAEIGHHHGKLALLATHLQAGRGFKHGVDDLVGEIAAESLANEAIAKLDLLGESLQLGFDALAVRDVGPRAYDLLRLAVIVVGYGESVLNPNEVSVAVPEAVLEGATTLLQPGPPFR